MIVKGTPSGDIFLGRIVGVSTASTSLTGFPAAKVAIRLDLPVPSSPATTIRIPKRTYGETVAMDTASAISKEMLERPSYENE